MENRSREYWGQRAQAARCHRQAFIDGRFRDTGGAELFEKESPIDGRILAQFPVGSADDVDLAVASARLAFEDGRWSQQSVMGRQAALLRLADLVEANAEELAMLDVLDVGKPVRDAVSIDLPLSLGVLRYCASAADKILGTVTPADSRTLAITVRSPRGVVGAIVGWNFPLVLAIQKMAPALAMGNTIVLKPSELSSFSALRLAELAVEAGIPPGVFNVLPGLGRTVGARLASHPDVDMLTFTGSSATGSSDRRASFGEELR